MFYCCKYSEIHGNRGAYIKRKSSFKPEEEDIVLMFSPYGLSPLDEKVISKKKIVHNIYNDHCVFSIKGGYSILCEECNTYLSVKEIIERGYFVSNGEKIEIVTTKLAPFDGWKEISGDFEYWAGNGMGANIKIKARVED